MCLGGSGISKVEENGVHLVLFVFLMASSADPCYFAFSTPIF